MSNIITNLISSVKFQFNDCAGAFYILNNQQTTKKDNPKWTKQIFNKVSGALKSTSLNLSNFNPVQFAKNISLGCPTKFAMEHIADVLEYTITSRPVKDSMMLDIFFDNFAPVLNLNLLNLGYNSLDSLKLGMKQGSISNPAQFLQGMSDGFDKIQNNNNKQQSNNMYEEILPIDVINSVSEIYNESLFIHQTDIGTTTENVLSNTPKIRIHLDATIKNPDANYLYPDDYINKLSSCMADKRPVILRAGKSLFKDCTIYYMNPVVNDNVYALGLNMELVYNYNPKNTNI